MTKHDDPWAQGGLEFEDWPAAVADDDDGEAVRLDLASDVFPEAVFLRSAMMEIDEQ